jgi:hypothetical protein
MIWPCVLPEEGSPQPSFAMKKADGVVLGPGRQALETPACQTNSGTVLTYAPPI